MRSRTGNSSIDLAALREKLAQTSGRTYWKSIEELAETEEFQDYLNHEFPAEADTFTDPVGRRRFLQLMGASFAFAGLTACTRQPDERLVPFVRAPEEIIPGKPLFYASSAPYFGYAQGVLVESHDGRPTKIEGNPKHPASLGATSVHVQASVLDLYDPDRLQAVTNAGRVRSWEVFAATLKDEIERTRVDRGRGLRILTGNVTSPTLTNLMNRLLSSLDQAEWHQYEPVNTDSARKGSMTAFGDSLNTYYRLDRADRVVSLDSDFMYWGPASVRYAKDFSARRRVESPDSEMNRLYVVESAPTVSASVADHRLSVRHGDVLTVAMALASALGLGVKNPVELEAGKQAFVDALAEDLKAHPGRSVIIPGEFQPAELHALAHWMNESLGNFGETVVHTDPIESSAGLQGESLARLVDGMKNGEVQTLIIIGGNPVYDAPADLDFAGALSEVPLKIHLTQQINETSQMCNWQVPESHYLEAWGDARAFDGTPSIVQPLIEPLYRSKSAIELVAVMLGEDPAISGFDLVQAYWSQSLGVPDFEKQWRRALHEGQLEKGAAEIRRSPVNTSSVAEALSRVSAPGPGLELILRPDPHVYDGRYSNNGWLQEAPKPLTKLTWDNAVLVSPAVAEEMGISSGDVVVLQAGGASVTGPAWIHPGHPLNSVTVHLGYGRRAIGNVGTGAGFNGYPLRSLGSSWHVEGVQLTLTGESSELACTQHHYSMEGRHLVREGSLEEFRQNPGFVQEMDHEFGKEADLYPGFESKGYAWGMTVDLGACIGCNACVVACQSENNIAVVGREQVRKGREMQWIRVDRYYEGDLDDPQTLFQPVMCQQCENAPCETVCPVAATNHTSEGLNDMVYNRCVGTRYCSNNCPYKVRRFNFLLYSDWQTEPLKLQRNPDVTVRSRGVMEKCTYCVQRINAAKIQSRLDDREVEDGEIKTACQQVCPTDAIVFGDINDPESQVSRVKKNQRNYGILTELKTKPRTTYLAKIRNPNPRLNENDDV